ncbi:MAG: hypothetical protein KDJ20_17725 [Hyphomicrobiales bacterium]|nr:hypothetical protein [Hyphomicrobiales bacterium]
MEDKKTVDWDHIRRFAWSNATPPKGWIGVRPISQEGLALLGIDEGGQLCWDGKPIQMHKTLRLEKWQAVLAFVVALGAAAQGLAA